MKFAVSFHRGDAFAAALLMAMLHVTAGLSNSLASGNGAFELADARRQRHCHTIGTRTYCHKADTLPVNWPPQSTTRS